MRVRASVAAILVALACGCAMEEPVRKPLPRSDRPARAPEQRRARAIKTPGPVGTLGQFSFFIEMQSDRADSEEKRPVLVEEDSKRRTVGFAYLPGRAVKGFVDEDVVVVATVDTLVCYDAQRHEVRWQSSFADSDREVDDFVRRGDKLDVSLSGGSSTTLDLATGKKSVP